MNDIDGFRDRIASAISQGEPVAGFSFDAGTPIHIAAAPGRLDVMGGVADYSGSLVAEATIGECAYAAVQRRSDRVIRVVSPQAEHAGHVPLVEVSVDEFGAGLRGCDGLRKRLNSDPAKRWAGYVIGCFVVLLARDYLRLPLSGADILVESDVPIGGGVSSSAALEIAAMLAIDAAYGAGAPGSELAVLAQTVENRIVGAPCGIMDQMAVAHGRRDALMLMLCRPHSIVGYLPLPRSIRVCGINSGVKHSVGADPYTHARIGAFMGRRIANNLLSASGQKPLEHLCEISPSRYRREFAAHMPASITGDEFLSRLGETGDPVTRVDPEARYAVRAATEHAVYENYRVEQFVAHLKGASIARNHTARAVPLLRAGEQMYSSHWSYTRIRLGSRETNLLVRIAREMGPARGIYGAKITGGGSGGTVALLTDAGSAAAKSVAELAGRYADESGHAPQVVDGGASPGALEMGTRTVE